MKDADKPMEVSQDVPVQSEAQHLEQELRELIEEGETRTEAYRKIMKEIEKSIDKQQD
ncbi:MAG: hypothetical protein ACPGU4_00845 [Flavobacteriales bacterium]